MLKSVIYITFLIWIISINSSLADRRYFGRSYLAYTLTAGAFELEVWNTGKIGKDIGYYYQFQPRFEFEYGVTEQFSASLYFNFNQVISEQNSFQSSSFNFSSTSLELRYQLTDQGKFIVDPAMYFEFAYGGDELEYESKIILSKRMNKFIAALNINSEIERDIVGNETESVIEITGGLMYEIIPNLAFGIEFRNHRGYDNFYKNENSEASFLGPTINVQTKSFNLTFNFLTQIAGSPSTSGNLELMHHEKFEFRTILGIEL